MGMTTRFFLAFVVALFTTSASPAGHYLYKPERPVVVDAGVYLTGLRSTSSSGISKRWDGSPAMGQELQAANNKACSLWSMLHLSDAAAGQLFTPPRALAHSDYLQLDGKMW